MAFGAHLADKICLQPSFKISHFSDFFFHLENEHGTEIDGKNQPLI